MAALAHVLIRALTCPLGPLMSLFPGQGRILDVGCGHGLLINLLSRDSSRGALELCGIDHDPAKIKIAQGAARPGVTFSTRAIQALPEASFDVISIVDVLYAVKRQSWSPILDHCFQAMKPEGTLIVKEVIDQPRWKYRAIMAQEMLSVTVLRITKGDRPHFESAATYRKAIVESGFDILNERPLGSASWISHYLFVAKKPAAGNA
jgi:2-polyprenyl-3-methyl-5-hydroxy-6-metoxy-1,4-benzoquinol methylase